MLARPLIACVVLLAMPVAGCGRAQRTDTANPDKFTGDRGTNTRGDGLLEADTANADEGSDERETNTGGADLLEYVFHGEGEAVRVLLAAEGGARIDFRREVGERQHISTVLVPTEAKEVERLVGAVDALIESDSARLVTVWLEAVFESMGVEPATLRERASESGDTTKRAPGSGDITIRCRKAGRDRMVRTRKFQENENYIWEGVRKEIEAVGQLELATAVDAYEDAEVRLKEGDRDGAVRKYDKAVKAFMAWVRSRCDRYHPAPVFEPTVPLRVEIPGREDRWIKIDAPPERCMDAIMQYSDRGQEWVQKKALETLPRAWQQCICGMVLSRSAEVTVVAFPQPVLPQEWAWGLVVTTIPSELVEYLKAENAWAGEGDQEPVGAD